MLKAVRAVSPLPLVASGGAGKPEDFARAVLEGGADAVLAASVFHDRRFSVGEVKREMRKRGIPVRLEADPLADVKFDESGLVPVVVRNEKSGEVLMLAWANAEALEATRRTGFSHFHSRSRKALWKKGETSGNVQRVTGISLDCDLDAIVYHVVPTGPACHTGSRSCFRRVETFEPGAEPPLSFDLGPLFEVVRSRKEKPVPSSYTNSLLEAGISRIAKKVGEEAVEAALAAVGEDDDALAGESADLLYHLVVLLTARGISPLAVEQKLRDRRGAKRR